MRGVYTAEAVIASLAAAKTVLLLEVPSDMVIEILAAHITNMDTDSNEQLEAGIFPVTTKGSPAGTSVTPQLHEVGDVASTVTALADLSAEPTTYPGVGIDRQGFSNLAGYRFDPLPEERPIVSPSKLIGLRLLGNPLSGFKASCQITYREIGG